jgi:hypothetical protein
MSNIATKPYWVRFFMLGLPDRVTAIIVWWLVMAAAIGLPIYCFVPGNVMPHLRLPSALFLGALMTVSNVMLGQAIRWMDQHSAWANADPTKQTAV